MHKCSWLAEVKTWPQKYLMVFGLNLDSFEVELDLMLT